AFELDERLHRFVERERGRVPVIRRTKLLGRGELARAGERILEVHADVQRQERKRAREISPGEGCRSHGKDSQTYTERRLFGHDATDSTCETRRTRHGDTETQRISGFFCSTNLRIFVFLAGCEAVTLQSRSREPPQ